MRLLPAICLFFFASSLFFTSCTKENTQPEQDHQSATDLLAAEAAFNEVFNMTDEQSKQEGDLNGIRSNGERAQTRGCMTADLQTSGNWPNIFPVTLTLDFGSACTTQGGDEISGKIVSVYTGKLEDEGTTATISLNDFEINGFKIKGSKQWTNNGLDSDGRFNYTVKVMDGEVTTPAGKVIQYSTTNTRTWIEGMDTNFWTNGVEGITDDVWEITGTSSGLNRRGESYTASITTPWRYEADCQWLTSGITQVETTGLNETASLDFGDGNCDNKATVSIGSWSTEIELK